MPSNTDDATRDPEVKVGNLHLHTQPRFHNRTPWPILISFVPAVLGGSDTCCLSHCCQPHTFSTCFSAKARLHTHLAASWTPCMVQEFTQAAGETTESFTTDDGSGSGPQTQTRQSVSAGESEGGQPQHSYGDMVRPGGALGDGRGSLLESI